jgi:Co/Zn/Cd efflux system component
MPMTAPSPQEEEKPEEKKEETPLGKKQARVLRAITIIKSVMFIAEGISSFFAHSMSMKSDSLDAAGDAAGAGTSLLVRNHSPRWQAWVSVAKAGVMGAGSLAVLAGVAFLFLNPVVLPATAIMAIVGGAMFIGNATCAALIYKYRKDNINMSSTWKCVRNDTFSNIGVLAVAAIGHFLISPIPDAVVGVAVAGLCIKSSIEIALDARKVLRTEKAKRKNSPAPAQLSKQQPKMIAGFKKTLRAVFNSKAAAAEKTAPIEKAPTIEKTPAPAVTQEPPVQEPVASKPAEKQTPPRTKSELLTPA